MPTPASKKSKKNREPRRPQISTGLNEPFREQPTSLSPSLEHELRATLNRSINKLLNEASRRGWVEPFQGEAQDRATVVWSMVIVAGDDRQEYFDHERLKKFADLAGPVVQLQLTDAKGERIVLFVDTTATSPRR